VTSTRNVAELEFGRAFLNPSQQNSSPFPFSRLKSIAVIPHTHAVLLHG